MSYQKRKLSKRNNRFVALPYDMLNSSAFQNLSPKAVRIFIEIKRRYNGSNNGEISIGYAEAGKVAKCTKNTAGKAITELIEHGFIKRVKIGQFTCNLASTYSLTCEENGKGIKTNEWKDWQKN